MALTVRLMPIEKTDDLYLIDKEKTDMDKDCIAAIVFMTILLSVFTCFLGVILGFNTADGHWESLIADAGHQACPA